MFPSCVALLAETRTTSDPFTELKSFYDFCKANSIAAAARQDAERQYNDLNTPSDPIGRDA